MYHSFLSSLLFVKHFYQIDLSLNQWPYINFSFSLRHQTNYPAQRGWLIRSNVHPVSE